MKKYRGIILAVLMAVTVSCMGTTLSASAKSVKSAKTVKSAKSVKVKKSEQTSVVYPTLSEISQANEIYANLSKGNYSSLTMSEKSGNDTTETSVFKEDATGEIQTLVSGSGICQVQKGNLNYVYNKKGFVSIYAATAVTSGSISYPYTVFSNETVTSITEKKNTYQILTTADVSGMTKEEQENIIGVKEGVVEKKLVINKETLLLKKYTYTMFFDKSNEDFKSVSKTTFSYGENVQVPQAVTLVMNTSATRTVTLVSNAGTQQEKKEVYTIPDTMPLYLRTSEELYQDELCTEIFAGAKKDQNGKYPSYILYQK